MEGIQAVMETRGSNVIASLDMSRSEDIYAFVENYHSYLLGVKLHSDITDDPGMIGPEIRKKYPQLLVIEDRKFCDIGNTVRLQSEGITLYANLITVHALPGQGIIDGLREHCLKNACRILLIAEMSSEGNLLGEEYTKKVVELAENNKDVVVGFISQRKLSNDFLHFTPGISIDSTGDGLKQRYTTPQIATKENGSDVLIVGRGLYAPKEVDEKITPQQFIDQFNTFDLWKMMRELRDLGIVQTRDSDEFVLKSGEKSNVYVDFRRLMAFPDTFNRMGILLCKHMFQEKLISMEASPTSTNVIMGVPLGGVPLSVLVAQQLQVPLALIRPERKDHGNQNLIEGVSVDALKESKIVLIEDVVTTGSSVIQTIDRLKEIGVNVEENVTVVSILDRGEGILRIKETTGCIASTLFKLSELMNIVT
jgi:orotidine 5'-phosphate decarboxylase subfamily 1/orotate phosphoribosyltransferase